MEMQVSEPTEETGNMTPLTEGDKGALSGGDKEVFQNGSEEGVKNCSKESATQSLTNDEEGTEEIIKFIVICNKEKYNVTFDAKRTILDLKRHLQNLLHIPQNLQKIMIRGLAKDKQTLKELDVKNGTKVMVVGSKLDQIMAVAAVPCAQEAEEKTVNKEKLCKQKMHKKVVDKGKPEDAMIGIRNVKDPLPVAPLYGMVNKSGGKVRLTFKLELDQLWISTKERTDKVAMSSIKSVVSEPIEGHEEYHLMGIQLGTTDASRYWVYWVPAQYIDAIKNTILGM